MSIEVLLEKITEEKVILYHEVNGEIKATHPLKDVVYSAIIDKEPSFSFESNSDTSGYMKNDVFIFGSVAVVKSEWRPAIGYSWEEEKLTLLRLRLP